MNERLLSVEEVAEICSVKVRTVRTWILERRIPYVKLGRYVRIREDDLQGLIQRSVVNARDDAPSSVNGR